MTPLNRSTYLDDAKKAFGLQTHDRKKYNHIFSPICRSQHMQPQACNSMQMSVSARLLHYPFTFSDYKITTGPTRQCFLFQQEFDQHVWWIIDYKRVLARDIGTCGVCYKFENLLSNLYKITSPLVSCRQFRYEHGDDKKVNSGSV